MPPVHSCQHPSATPPPHLVALPERFLPPSAPSRDQPPPIALPLEPPLCTVGPKYAYFKGCWEPALAKMGPKRPKKAVTYLYEHPAWHNFEKKLTTFGPTSDPRNPSRGTKRPLKGAGIMKKTCKKSP